MSPLKEIFILSLLSITGISAIAQLQPAYSFQKDDTLLRKNFFQQSVKKKELLIVAAKGKENADDYKKMYEQQFDDIDELWQSTRAVTSPEEYTYLQSIVTKIISANSELKGTDARVVFSRDWWPNAVSMGDGTIAINAGLLVFMDNEAELVFVICHELSHYYLEHTPQKIRKFVETINSEAYQSELKKISKTEYGAGSLLESLAKSVAFGSHRHSREFEAAADKQAFLFMKKTGYDLHAIQTTLELLDKIDDTAVYKPLELPQLLNFADYPFKKKWIQKESAIFAQVTNPSGLTDKERDSLKTHPDCTKRIALLADSLRSVVAPGKKFLVNEKLFGRLKKDMFAEITEECYREKNLGRNLYYNLLLLQANENTGMAVYSIARCLNLLFESQKNHKIGLMIDTESKGYPEDYNLLLRMLSRLRLDEIASLGYGICDKYASQVKGYPGFEEEMNKTKKYKQQSAL